jgi:DNA-binding transcriptional regulator LsrR (DeoR family)
LEARVPRPRQSEAHGPAWLVQAALIARRFYLEGHSKVEIGEDLGLSRFKVARILDDARDLGLVEVHVRLPAQIDADLSSRLCAGLGLRRAIVVAGTVGGATNADDHLYRVAADLLTELVGDDDVLGMSCSRSVAATAQALRALGPCDVVQLTGTLASPERGAGSVESVRLAATIGGGAAHLVYAPMLLPDPATAQALAGEPGISRTLDLIGTVTIGIVAIGAWCQDLSTLWAAVSEEERSACSSAGAVGEIGGRVFDAEGKSVTGTVDERVLGATLEQVRGIDEVVGLAYGARRSDAVRAAATGGLITSLVCDTGLAGALLDRPHAGQEP